MTEQTKPTNVYIGENLLIAAEKRAVEETANRNKTVTAGQLIREILEKHLK